MLVGLVADAAASPLKTVEVDLNKQGRTVLEEGEEEEGEEEEEEEDIPTPWFGPALGVGVVACILAIGAYAAFAMYLSGAADSEIARLEEQITTEKQQVDQMSKQQEEVAVLKQKQELLNKIVNHGAPRTAIMQVLKNTVPEGVQVTGFTLTDNKLDASCLSTTFAKASHYAINLQGSNLLEDCKIANIHRLKAFPEMIGFSLTGLVKPDASNIPLEAADAAGATSAPADPNAAPAVVPASAQTPSGGTK
jgi:Tfp pilus assembly protein PilN